MYTIGKEIENTFLSPDILSLLIDKESIDNFQIFWNKLFNDRRLTSFGSYLTLHKQFLDSGLDTKTITTEYGPVFEKCWNDLERRHLIIDGKEALGFLRAFYRSQTATNLSIGTLVATAIKAQNAIIHQFIEEVYQERTATEQILHY